MKKDLPTHVFYGTRQEPDGTHSLIRAVSLTDRCPRDGWEVVKGGFASDDDAFMAYLPTLDDILRGAQRVGSPITVVDHWAGELPGTPEAIEAWAALNDEEWDIHNAEWDALDLDDDVEN